MTAKRREHVILAGMEGRKTGGLHGCGTIMSPMESSSKAVGGTERLTKDFDFVLPDLLLCTTRRICVRPIRLEVFQPGRRVEAKLGCRVR